MSNETSPLQPLGTQSQETINMAAAMAPEAVLAREREADRVFAALADQAVDAGHDESTVASKVGDAASWAMDKAKETLRSAADQVRDRTKAAVASRVRQDPVRAVLIAAGVGALLMAMLSSMARSGARTVRRKVRG